MLTAFVPSIVLVAVVLAAVGLAVWVLRLRWLQQLRWLVATAATDVTGPASFAGTFAACEVVVTGVTAEDGWATVSLYAEVGARLLEVEGVATLTERAYLQRWEAARTPLLLMTTGDGESSLHGPRHVVTGLWVARERDRHVGSYSPERSTPLDRKHN